MSKIGYGYGSECHLLRWMGRHRNSFNKAISLAIRLHGNEKIIHWVDFGFNNDESHWHDSEPTRLNFINNEITKMNWEWPKSGVQQNWDSIGYIVPLNNPTQEQSKEILLLEAKAHLAEIKSPSCGAGIRSMKKIKEILKNTAKDLGVSNYSKVEDVWLNKYYQTANRLATYNYLKKSGYKPYLVFLYFINDQHEGVTCPSQVFEWENVLSKQKSEMGINDVFINESVYNLFIDAQSDDKCWTSSSTEFPLK